MPKKTNDGILLERLVKLIEGMLLPQGFEVESRKLIYNEKGLQIAELDIVITGRLGSASISWLIECRDRPSEGPAPISWIEQLTARRGRLKFDKVMAVSTTGFSESATEEADRVGIELRTLDEQTFEQVAQWLPFNAPIVIRNAEFNEIRVYLKEQTDHESEGLTESIPIDIKNAIFLYTETGEDLTILKVWQKILSQNQQLFDNVQLNAEPIEKIIHVDCTKHNRYTFISWEKSVAVIGFEFKAKFSVETLDMTLFQINRYTDSQKTIAQIARWHGKEGDTIQELLFIGIPKTDHS